MIGSSQPLLSFRRSSAFVKQFTLLFSLIFFSYTGLAHANTDQKIKVAIQQAKTASQKGQHKAAAEAYRRAYALSDESIHLYSAAQSYFQAKMWVESFNYYQLFLEEDVGSDEGDNAQRQLKVLENKLKDSYEEVVITSQPPGAHIYIKNKVNGSYGVTPLTVKLLPGEHKVIAELKGYVPSEETFNLRSGASFQLSLTLDHESDVAPVRFLVNRIKANIYVDRRLRARSPLKKSLLIRKGKREIRVSKPGYKDWIRTIEVKPELPMTLDVQLLEEGQMTLDVGPQNVNISGSPIQLGPWLTMGSGLLVLGGGTFFGLRANSLYTQLEQLKDNQMLVNPIDIDRGNQDVLLTNILVGVGVAVLTGGGIWYMMGSEDSESEKALEAKRFEFNRRFTRQVRSSQFESTIQSTIQQ